MSEDTQEQENSAAASAEQDFTSTGVIKISLTSKKTGRKASFEREVGRNLDEMSALYGSEVVHAMAVSELTVRLQGACRTILDVTDERGLPKNSIEDGINAAISYIPGKHRRRADAGVSKEKAFTLLAKQIESGEMTLDQLMAEIQKRQSGE